MTQTTTISGLPNATLPLTGAERIIFDQGTQTVDLSALDFFNQLAPVKSVALALPAGWGTQSLNVVGSVTLSLSLPIGQSLLAATDKTAWDAAAVLAGTAVQPAALATALAGKADLVDGAIPSSQLPALAITDYLGAVASQAALLALTGQRGDWAIRLDRNSVWILSADAPAQLASWVELPIPSGVVLQVNGQTGVVTLGPGDVGADPAGTAAAAIAAHLQSASHHAPASLAASLQAVFDLSGQELAAQSPGANLTRLHYWNPATSRLEFLALGTNLSISTGQLNAAGGSPGGSPGELQWNSGEAFTGLSTSAIDGSGNLTLSGRIISSRNSAANAPAILTTGTWVSGGTGSNNLPHILIQHSAATSNTAWDTDGTGLAVFGSAINQRLIDAGVNGSSFFRLHGSTIEIGPTSFQGWLIDGLSLVMRNVNNLGWNSGAATSLSMDTFWSRASAGVVYQQGGTTAQSYWLANTISGSGSNFERMRMGWESNVFTFRTEAGGTGTARGIRIGASSAQLLGFWGATPVARPAAIADATDLASAITAVNALLAAARLVGLIAT